MKSAIGVSSPSGPRDCCSGCASALRNCEMLEAWASTRGCALAATCIVAFSPSLSSECAYNRCVIDWGIPGHKREDVMTKVDMSLSLNVPVEKIWNLIGGFDALARSHPPIARAEAVTEGAKIHRNLPLPSPAQLA